MAGDYTRMTFRSEEGPLGRAHAAGPRHARRRLERARRAARPPPARGDRRHARPLRRLARDARRVPDRASRRRADDRPRPRLRPRPARREPRRRPARVRPGARRGARHRADRLRRAALPARTRRRRAAARRPARTSPTSTSGGARSPASRTRTSSRRRSASTPRRACRPPGRCACSRRPTARRATSQLPAWDALTAPSAGRLTTAAVGVPATHRPVHDPAHRRLPRNREPPLPRRDPRRRPARARRRSSGRATTPRSRSHVDDDRRRAHEAHRRRASAATACARISVDDWVEVTDDWRELNGLPGELRKVAAVDEVNADDHARDAADRPACSTRPTPRATRASRAGTRRAPAVDAAGGVIAGSGRRPARRSCSRTASRSRFDADPGRRRLPRRRLLGVRRAHRRRLGRGARRGAAARDPAPLLPARPS